MHWAQSICVMEPPSSNNTPYHHHHPFLCPENQFSQGSRWGRSGEKFPVQYFVCGICMQTMCVSVCACISDLCVCVHVPACACICTSVHMQILPFYDHVSTVAYTTTPWQRYCDRGYLSAIWGPFCHSFSSPSCYPIRHFPRGSLSLLPSAGMACILIN